MAKHDIDTSIERGKKIVVYGVIGIGATAGLFFLTRFLIKKHRKNKEEKDSATGNTASTYAKMLHMAFTNDNLFSWGTNNEEVSRVINAIPSRRAYTDVQKSYKNLYGKPLNEKLEKELTSEQYRNIVLILSTKPV